MNFNKLFAYLKFSKEQTAGVLSLFIVIIIFQICFFYTDFSKIINDSPEKQSWISNQAIVDSLKGASLNAKPTIYLFNPNFISDYKGYKLGMSVAEIDRLLSFRKQNKYVNSAQEFQDITLVSDSLLESMSKYFKFPDWINAKRNSRNPVYKTSKAFAKVETVTIKDINLATQEDLMEIYGVGLVLSERILKLREAVDNFVSMDQMNDVWGLTPEVIGKLKTSFKIVATPALQKIDINNASVKELAKFIYFKNGLSREIVIFRSMNGDFTNIEDLTKIKGFPIEKANIIALYLDFR